MGSILGGGGSSSTSTSGYSALSPALRAAFDPLGQAVSQYTNPNNPGVKQMFTPMAQTSDETNAFNQFRQGFAPTQKSLNSDVSMLMNPYDHFVTDEINRQAGGDYSLLKQSLNEAGQMGSNRQNLGANDIDLSRINQIGTFKQSQYNNAINQVLNNIIPQRQQDAASLLGIGQFQRGLDTQTRQAPIAALQAGTSMLGPFVSGGSSSQNSNNSSGIGGLLGGFGSLLGTGGLPGLISALPSDRSLKENIIPMGTENGFNIYEFNYIGAPEKFIGVMADEVESVIPEAVTNIGAYKAVYYNKIGVEFRRAHG